MRYLITDELWLALGPAIQEAKRNRSGRKPQLPDRLFFEALLYLARTGVPWRDLSGDFGAWDAVYNRFRRWASSGGLARLFEILTDRPESGEVRRVLIDSTINPGAPTCGRGAGKKAGRRRRASAAAGAATPA